MSSVGSSVGSLGATGGKRGRIGRRMRVRRRRGCVQASGNVGRRRGRRQVSIRRGRGGVKEELKKEREELRGVKEEMRKEREDRRRVEKEWREERRRWKEGLREEKVKREVMEKKVERMEVWEGRMEERMEKVESWGRDGEVGGGKGKQEREELEECRRRMRVVELRQDRKEREERRENVVIRGLVVGGNAGVREEVKSLWERIGLEEGGIKEVVRLGKAGKEKYGMVLVKLKGREEKIKSDGGEEETEGQEGKRIEDDLTEQERWVKWMIEREAEKERERGRKVRVGYMKMWIDGKLRRWNEWEEKWDWEQGNEKVVEGRKGGEEEYRFGKI